MINECIIKWRNIEIDREVYVMKKILSLVLLATLVTIMSLSQTVAASHKTIKFGASWDYGRNAGIYAYSNVTSSTNPHRSTVTCGSSSNSSGNKPAGEVSYASLWVAPWDSPNYYYSIW